MTTADVADKPFGCRIDPPYDSRVVEDVARDTNVRQSPFDIPAYFKASGHQGQAADLPTEHHVVVVAPPDAAQTLDSFMSTSYPGSTSITLSAIVQQTRVLVILTKG